MLRRGRAGAWIQHIRVGSIASKRYQSAGGGAEAGSGYSSSGWQRQMMMSLMVDAQIAGLMSWRRRQTRLGSSAAVVPID